MLALDLIFPQWDMADFTPCTYSKREVVDAGKLLAREIPFAEARSELTLEAFRIARSWREASVYPMLRVRAELLGKLRAQRATGITAARLKRMISIRKKLRSTYFTLYQMQDLAGCRAILRGHADLDRVLTSYLAGETRYSIVRHDDYLAHPQNTGYRSHHLVLKFADPDNAGFDRHFVEIQLRTDRQHSWATAVEAVGLVRNEDLKGGSGNQDWLRLFQLMAGEFAEEENTAPIPGVSADRLERRKELTELNDKLKALSTLESYNQAIRHTEFLGRPIAQFYLLQFDIQRREVNVSPFYQVRAGSAQYERAESNRNVNSVFVEVEKVADLRAAYPNYFLDVEAFVARLTRALHVEKAKGVFDEDFMRRWLQRRGKLR